MRTIPAREVKRRGIGVVDEMIGEGPVHVIRNDRPMYVIMTEAQYEEWVEARRVAEITGIQESLEDVAAGRVRRVTARQLIEESGLVHDV
ncbi:MAG: prevent-host-death protein [Chloroflexota bacterium]|nr:prevent-host-death protein [Chloroflexota bacterium]